MQFAGVKEKVTLSLEGDFHRDIRGAKIRFRGEGRDDDVEAASYMDSFAAKQTGKVWVPSILATSFHKVLPHFRAA